MPRRVLDDHRVRDRTAEMLAVKSGSVAPRHSDSDVRLTRLGRLGIRLSVTSRRLAKDVKL